MFLALAVISPAALASPIPAQTLWHQVAHSELIVVARVAEVRELPLPPEAADDVWVRISAMGRAVAVLEVEERWKGTSDETVEVSFSKTLVCPAPDRYIEGRTVLAFLAHGRADETWDTVGLSYGTLYPSQEDLPAFRSLVHKAVALQGTNNGEADPPLDWLVETAAHPGTRWHGLFELTPKLDPWEARRTRSELRPSAQHRLLPRHLALLADGFAAEPRVDDTTAMALAVLQSYPSPKVDLAAASVIEAALAWDEAPYWIRDLMLLTLDRFNDPDPEARLAYFTGVDWDTPDVKTLRVLWRAARQELGIPKTRPAKLRDHEVWGVGEATPD